jgi:hypothetical protein
MEPTEIQESPEQREKRREQVHIDMERIAAASDTHFVSPPKAAFFLGISEKELESRRAKKQPPPPTPNWVEGKKGVPVTYFVRTLVEHIRGAPISQKNPYINPLHGISLGGNAAAANAAADRKARSMLRPMRWESVSSIENDDNTEPFFVDKSDRVVMYCWEDYTKTCDFFFSASIEIEWMGWVDALARVWESEEKRLKWLGTADEVAPGLREAVEAKRSSIFSKI